MKIKEDADIAAAVRYLKMMSQWDEDWRDLDHEEWREQLRLECEEEEKDESKDNEDEDEQKDDEEKEEVRKLLM